MDTYSDYDFLCNEPYYMQGVGHINNPTLRDIRKTTYHMFSIFVNVISMELEDYLAVDEVREKYLNLPEPDREKLSYFEVISLIDTYVMVSMLKFFISDELDFSEDKTQIAFDIFSEASKKEKIGSINRDNFDDFRLFLRQILGIIKEEEKPKKFKNEYAKKMYEKMQEHQKKEETKLDANYTFDNMIKKYCTHNKVGINILNVWDITYYQFRAMFNEFDYGRQCDYSQMIAANTFSYSKPSDYQQNAYMKKI